MRTCVGAFSAGPVEDDISQYGMLSWMMILHVRRLLELGTLTTCRVQNLHSCHQYRLGRLLTFLPTFLNMKTGKSVYTCILEIEQEITQCKVLHIARLRYRDSM